MNIRQAEQEPMQGVVAHIVGWLFSGQTLPATPGRVIGWWELRRIPFNLIVGTAGAASLLAVLWAVGTSGHLEPGEDAVEPIALIAAPVLANLLYSGGWLLEVAARHLKPDLSPRFGATVLKLGLGLSLVLVWVPAAVWLPLRLYQLLNVK